MKIILASDALRRSPLDLDATELHALAQSASLTALREAAAQDVPVFGTLPDGQFFYADASNLLPGAQDALVIQTCGQIAMALRGWGHRVAVVDLSVLNDRQIDLTACDLLIVDVNVPRPADDLMSALFVLQTPWIMTSKYQSEAIGVGARAGESMVNSFFWGSFVKPLSGNRLKSLVCSAEDRDRVANGRQAGSAVA